MSTFAKSVSIIVPTRNEAENVAMLVAQIVSSAVPFHEILFVDHDSTDGTCDVIRSLMVNHPIRLIKTTESLDWHPRSCWAQEQRRESYYSSWMRT